MRILAIGDTHGDLDTLRRLDYKGVDLILLTGDVPRSVMRRNAAFEDIARRERGLPPKIRMDSYYRAMARESSTTLHRIVSFLAKKAPVFMVYGNVEYFMETNHREEKKRDPALPSPKALIKTILRAKIINEKTVTIDGIRIIGLPFFTEDSWVKTFAPESKARLPEAKKTTVRIRRFLAAAGKADIVLSHIPPYGVLDKVTAPYAPESFKGKHAGSKILLDYIKKHRPGLVVCGHIHEAKGVRKVGKTTVRNLGEGDCFLITI